MTRSKRFSCLVAGLIALPFVAAQSSAALLPVTAEARFLVFQPWVPALTLTGSGVGDSVGGGLATIPAGLFAGNDALVVPAPPTFLGLTEITVPAGSLGNPAGSFAPNGVLGLDGAAFFNSLTLAPFGSFQLAPVGGGGNGAFAFGPTGTLLGATWMGDANGTLPGGGVFSQMGAVLCIPISTVATAYDNRTPGGAGTVQLVAPARVDLGIYGSAPLFGVLTLTYTPEPGTLTLLGAGVAALAMIGRRKLEKTR